MTRWTWKDYTNIEVRWGDFVLLGFVRDYRSAWTLTVFNRVLARKFA